MIRCVWISIFTLVCAVTSVFAGEPSTVDDKGFVTVHPVPMEDKYKNPTTDAFEKDFQKRYNELLILWTRDHKTDGFGKVDKRLFFESEKWSYPHAMMHILAGNVAPGVAILQANDQPQSGKDNAHTLGIDLYPAFTLKGQVRKYFQFGHLLDPAYKKKMDKAIKIWTEKHPRYTPHPIYKKYDPKAQGWGPNRFGHRQVDGRRTDNLYIMSTSSIYLFAEASGNERTRLRAKSELLGYVWALYNIGHGEWDSTTYQPHVTAPFLSLYDFAKDPEVKLAAKLALDQLFTAMAIKYQRGAFIGASKRDYGGGSYDQMNAPAVGFFELYFGQAPHHDKEHDQLHAMASNYRPPQAVLNLAHRKLDLPVEIRACKPEYENWQPGQSARPRNFETVWIGRHGGMGSVIDPSGNGDLAPFRIVLNRGKDGADVIALSSSGTFNTAKGGEQISQYGNIAAWVSKKRNSPWSLLVPAEIKTSEKDGVLFLEGEKSWVALRGYGVAGFEKTSPPTDKKARKKFNKKYGSSDLRNAKVQEDTPFTAFAIEVGEEGMYDDFAAFQKAVLSKGHMKVDTENKVVTLTGGKGKVLEAGLPQGNGYALLKRDGEAFDFDDPKNWALWKTVGDKNVVSLGWKEGVLKVEAGGNSFTATFALEGFTGPEVLREQLEKEKTLKATATFENK